MSVRGSAGINVQRSRRGELDAVGQLSSGFESAKQRQVHSGTDAAWSVRVRPRHLAQRPRGSVERTVVVFVLRGRVVGGI
jgi:uncharacterized membrane protein